VTNDGVLLPEVKRHYMRIRPPECGEPYAHEECGKEMIHIANRCPGEKSDFEAREVVDGGFLELVRYGVRRADDPVIVDTLKVIDHVLKIDAPQGPCWRRYNHDGYGQRHDGGPFQGCGQGRAWPLLTGERAHYELAAGRDISSLIETYERFASEGGMMPEQIWDEPDRNGLVFGGPAGSAMPLVWAHAEHVKLLRSLADGAVFDMPPQTVRRYLKQTNTPRCRPWRPDWRAETLPAGRVLRIDLPEAATVHWSADRWGTVTDSTTQETGLGVHTLALPTEDLAPGTRIVFTWRWRGSGTWAGRDYLVTVE